MNKPKPKPVTVMGPCGNVTISGCIMQALKPEKSFHYGDPVISQARHNGPICVYVNGNGPMGQRVTMVARQEPRRCVVEARIAPLDFVVSSTPFTGPRHIYLEA